MNNIYKNAAPVTASNTANIPNPSQEGGGENRGCFLYIGVSLATLKVLTSGGQEITLKAPAVGRVLEGISVVRVFSTGTSAHAAGDIVALWM